MTTSSEKARAWRDAAKVLERANAGPHPYLNMKKCPLCRSREYIRTTIIPALIRRAEIIERNGRKR